MGIHWYAKSREMIEIAREFEEVERRIVLPLAEESAINRALDDRERLFARESEARKELERRGSEVTMGAIRGWPSRILEHFASLGAVEDSRRVLDVIGWGTDYYIENLREAGVPMNAFSQPLDSLRILPEQARGLGEELLGYASAMRAPAAGRQARVAGLWLYLWGFVDCSVEAGQ